MPTPRREEERDAHATYLMAPVFGPKRVRRSPPDLCCSAKALHINPRGWIKNSERGPSKGKKMEFREGMDGWMDGTGLCHACSNRLGHNSAIQVLN